jgi:GT2 family glycosyltransferase
MPAPSASPPPPQCELSVVIAAFQAASTIGAQLEALRTQVWDGAWEIVVVDNGSTDGTPAVVGAAATRDARIRLIEASELRGAAFARNAGVEHALGESILFCDADDVVAGGWLPAMAEALRTHEFVTGPQEYETLNPEWMHGAFGTRTAHELQHFSGIFPFGPTANLGMRRTLFDSIGGFDTTFMVGQDVELCLRAWLAGAELQFVEAAVVHYRYRQDLRSLWRRARQYGSVAPAIARRLATAGRPTPRRMRGLRNWVWLVRHIPTLRTQSGRGRYLVVAGGVIGRLSGSVRHRRLLL